MGGNPFRSLSYTTPLNSSNDGSIFSGISTVETFSLTTKARLYFISFDSTKNSPRLHMDMNLDFSSSVNFRIGGIDFIIKLLSSKDFTLLTVA